MFESFLGVNPWTALFILLNTLTIYFVEKKYLFVPVMNIIDQRQKEIDDLYAQAGTAQQEALACKEEYQQKLRDAHITSEQIVKDAVLRGQQREDEIIRSASTEAAAMLSKASADIAQEKKKALNDAKDEISSLAMAIATKVVGRELSSTDQARMVDSFIDDLGGSL